MHWLRRMDHQVFHWFNRELRSSHLDVLFGTLTHLGGATFTIAGGLLLSFFGVGVWKAAGMQIVVALIISHLIVIVIKNSVRRIRPYLKLDNVMVGRFPLKDYSFPSGHSTAISAFVTPLLIAAPPFVMILLSIVVLAVGLSRIYWGYHFPFDCLVGVVIGSVTAGLVVMVTNF